MLANAIITKAADDYRLALRGKESQHIISEVERFFKSPWFGKLTSLDPDMILVRIRKEEGRQ